MTYKDGVTMEDLCDVFTNAFEPAPVCEIMHTVVLSAPARLS